MTNERKALLWIKAWTQWNPECAKPEVWPQTSDNLPMEPPEIVEAGLTGRKLPYPPQHLIDQYGD